MTTAKALAHLARGNGKFPLLERTVIYDLDLCVGLDELRETIGVINSEGYLLICVTQSEDTYTVFFGRPAYG